MKTIVTHSGSFHADEALAVFMLRLLPRFKGHRLVRSRDPAVIEQADIVVDVGGEYLPEKHRYDHHQRSFTSTYSADFNIKLSSAGLIYKHFGSEVVASILKSSPKAKESDDFPVDEIVARVYKKLILGFDGHDNGVNKYPSELSPAYEEPNTIANRVSRLNPDWNEPSNDTDFDEGFLKAVELTGEELVYWVLYR